MASQRDLASDGLFLGIMSGTSVDGIDIALVAQHEGKSQFIAGEEFPYDNQLRTEILQLCQAQSTDLLSLGLLTQRISAAYATAVEQFLHKQQRPAASITAIGCHGQTVYHYPQGPYPFSTQLLNPALLAARTGISVVSDFRSMDMALGGQGAPLVPLFHRSLLEPSNKHAGLVFLNIGGMANISVLNPLPLTGYDTGPGNVLLDGWIKQVKGQEYDFNGDFAASGRVHKTLLQTLLQEPYFAQPPPKSTGREKFNIAWLQQALSKLQAPISDADVMATLVDLTITPIVTALADFAAGQLLVCGGGAKNAYLLKQLQAALPRWQVISTDKKGISADFIEAMAFAWLAYRCLNAQAGNAPGVTGASREEVCGAITRVVRQDHKTGNNSENS